MADLIDIRVTSVPSISSEGYDAVLLVHWPGQKTGDAGVAEAVAAGVKLDAALGKEVTVLPLGKVPAGRLVLVSTGDLDADYDDGRSFRDAAVKGVKRALKAGIRRPLVYLHKHDKYNDADLIVVLAVLEALHVPIQVRELKPSNIPTVEVLGFAHEDESKTSELIKLALTLERGRRVARDIGGGDPERMAPPRVEEYVRQQFAETCIKISTVSDLQEITEEYPLFEAVNRAARDVERHQGRIVFLEYEPSDASKVKDTVYLVGKGVTYDTGGADLKVGGVMAGMSRDKCGAAAVAGFMKIVSILKPDHLKVVAALSLVRNSIGSNSYVSDELIKSRSGALVRVGNTDAEGRMIMADVLCKMKELASASGVVNPHLYTIATLTGHAYVTAGPGYSIAVDNGPAQKVKWAEQLQQNGEVVCDPFEVSKLRREDVAFHRGLGDGDDIRQCNNLPSSKTCRGHQGPAAFLLLASGLEKHGSGSKTPLRYTHLDIAGSAGDLPDPPTGAPILALAKTYLL